MALVLLDAIYRMHCWDLAAVRAIAHLRRYLENPRMMTGESLSFNSHVKSTAFKTVPRRMLVLWLKSHENNQVNE